MPSLKIHKGEKIRLTGDFPEVACQFVQKSLIWQSQPQIGF